MNQNGGINPSDLIDLRRAVSADLVTLPLNVEGTNCWNCSFISNGQGPARFCHHPQVWQPVTERMCCAFWDAPGTLRAWT